MFDRILNRAIGAVAVTVPTCWYLLQQKPESHGHGDHGDHGAGHGKEHGEERHEEESKDEPEAAAESKDDDKDSEKSNNSDSGDESKDADTPDTSDDEGDNKSKDSGKSDTPKTPSGDRKIYPDPKGANKTRTDSDKAQKQGKPEDTSYDGSYPAKDKVCSIIAQLCAAI
jgi:hypothetical protein